MMKNIVKLLAIGIFISGCSVVPENSNRYGFITPESLLQSSKDVINVNLDGESSINRLKKWLGSKPPSYAEVSCNPISPLCKRAEKLLKASGVEVRVPSATTEADVVLVYSSTVALDCDSTYKDNPINPYNFTHQSAGCALSSNTIRMVSDRTEFTDPLMRSDTDGKRTMKAYDAYTNKAGDLPDFQALNKDN